jgi:hypothetical protein
MLPDRLLPACTSPPKFIPFGLSLRTRQLFVDGFLIHNMTGFCRVYRSSIGPFSDCQLRVRGANHQATSVLPRQLCNRTTSSLCLVRLQCRSLEPPNVSSCGMSPSSSWRSVALTHGPINPLLLLHYSHCLTMCTLVFTACTLANSFGHTAIKSINLVYTTVAFLLYYCIESLIQWTAVCIESYSYTILL